MPEGLSASEVGKEIAEHREEHHSGEAREARDRLISIAEAVLLSLVALMAAWSGYSAAKWGTESSLSLAKASATRTKANLAAVQATQIRGLDAIAFNAALTAYTSGDARLFRLTLRRLRPGYRPAVNAWLASHPLKNPHAVADPSDLPLYHVPQAGLSRTLNEHADEHFAEGESAAGTADRYVRLTVFLAAVLFLVGVGSHSPVRTARYGLLGVAGALFIVSLVQLLALPGPPG